MENRQIKRNNRKIIIALIILMLVISCLFSIITPFKAVAENENDSVIEYTSVLEDLQKDENFNIEEYPVVENNYSLQVIQIAESSNNELFIYVYQPSGQDKDLRARYINMSLTDSVEDTSLYSLTYLNSYQTLFKYVVKNLTISLDSLRYYNISSVYRDFIEGVDKESDYNNEISAVSFAVGKLWEAYSSSSVETVYTVYETEIIEIVDKYVGFIRYVINYQGDGYDSHFVAFSTDHNIDKLINAKVRYSSQTVYYRENSSVSFSPEFGEINSENEVVLYADKKHVVEATDGWFNSWTYEWDEIQSVDEFISSVEMDEVFNAGIFDTTVEVKITENGYEDLENKQWVLNFAETVYDRTQTTGGMGIAGPTYIDKTLIQDVTILELTFEVNGIVYNLGVVDNMQSGDGVPDNETNITTKYPNWLQAIIDFFNKLSLGLKIFFGILLVLILIVVIYFVYKLFKWIFESIKKLFGGE